MENWIMWLHFWHSCWISYLVPFSFREHHCLYILHLLISWQETSRCNLDRQSQFPALVDGSCGLNREKIIGALEKSDLDISSGDIHNRDMLHTLWEELIAAGSRYLVCSLVLESKMFWSLVSHITKKQDAEIVDWIGECVKTHDETKCLLSSCI